MPHFEPIGALQRKTLPHIGSVELTQDYYEHTYSRVFGPVDNNPPEPDFGGFQSGTVYKVEYERWDTTAGEYVDIGVPQQWTHP